LQWATALVNPSTLSSQLASRSHESSVWDQQALDQAIAHTITISSLPLVFTISTGIDTTIPPIIEGDVDGGEDVGNLAETSKIAGVFYMGRQPTRSGPFRSYRKSVPGSSNTASDELAALAEGTREATMLNSLLHELSGNSPGLYNWQAPSPFAATLLQSSSNITSQMEVSTATFRELVVDLHAQRTVLNSDSKVVTDVITAEGKTSTAKRLRGDARALRLVQHNHSSGQTFVQFKPSHLIRANPPTKLPPGPLQYARDLEMSFGNSPQYQLFLQQVETRYAKKPIVREDVIVPHYLEMINSEKVQAFHVSFYPDEPTAYLINRGTPRVLAVRPPFESLPASGAEENWVKHCNPTVTHIFQRYGLEDERARLWYRPAKPEYSRRNANLFRRISTDGIGYTGQSYGNRRVYSRVAWFERQQQKNPVNSPPINPNPSSPLPTNLPIQPILLHTELSIGGTGGLLGEDDVSDLEDEVPKIMTEVLTEEEMMAKKILKHQQQRDHRDQLRLQRQEKRQLRLDQITAQNTINNSAVDQTATTVFLTNNNSQWVLNNRSVDNMQQLQLLLQHQQQLQQEINQHRQPTPKRSADNNHHPLTQRQLRVKAEEQRHPSLQFFGSISSSSQQRSYDQYQEQLGSQSKQVCLLNPGLRIPFSYHAGQNMGTGYTHGGSMGVAKRPKSKRTKEIKNERARKWQA